MPELDIRLLGTFHVSRHDEPLTGLATDKVRALLAYLAVERKHPHRREYLASLLWPDQTDKLSRQSLRQALLNLRQSLGDADDSPLLITPQDVQFNPSASIRVDVHEALALVHACRIHKHHGVGRCPACMQRQRALVDLYQGEFLAGFSPVSGTAFEEWLLLTREALHREAATALSRLSDFHERRGEYPEAIAFARQLVRWEPWHEQAYRLLMRLLARDGSRGEALAEFEHCRKALAEELSAAPAAETLALRDAILSGTLPPARPLARPPSASTSFVGRKKELADLEGLLADPDCRLLTIVGPGGMGKTRLAWQVAHHHHGLFADGVLFVPLAEAESANSGLLALADMLGLSEIPSGQAAARMADHLRDKEMLLVLDNFEHLIEEAEVVAGLLHHAHGIQILVTSRERLSLREEWVYPLESLAVPPSSDLSIDPDRYDAISLFRQRSAQTDLRFALTPEMVPDVADICRLVEGFPLGIELAAASSGTRPCSEIADSLRKTLDLVSGLRNVPARHRSLRAAFEHSWNLLAPEEQVLLASLSVCAGGFDGSAAEAIAGAPPRELDSLLEKSLLRLDPSSGRYGFHEVIRAFAEEKLTAVGNQEHRIRDAHAAYYAGASRELEAALTGPGQPAALRRLQAERANLLMAWRWALQAPDQAAYLDRLLPCLADLFLLLGPMPEGETLFRQAIDCMAARTPAPTVTLLRLHQSVARLCSHQAKHEQALAQARACVELAHSPSEQGQAYWIWGKALFEFGEYRDARDKLQQALEIARTIQDVRLEADCLRGLGETDSGLAENFSAIPRFQQAMELSRRLGDPRGECEALIGLGLVEWDLGQLSSAREHLENALDLSRSLSHKPSEARALNGLSNVVAVQGDLYASIRHCEDTLRIHREMGNPGGQSTALNNLGCSYWCLGQYGKARECYQQAYEMHCLSGNRQAQGEALVNLSIIAGLEGDYPLAVRLQSQAAILSEQTGDKLNLGNLYLFRGRIESSRGEFAKAEEFLLRSRDLRANGANPGRILEVDAELTFALFRLGRTPEAHGYLGPILSAIETSPQLEGADEPFRVYWQVVQTLQGMQHPLAAPILTTAVRLLKERAALITDKFLQASFLENIAEHKALLATHTEFLQDS